MALRALSGETDHGGGRRGSTGVQIMRGVKSVGSWVRPGQPVGAKVDLLGSKMYEFLGTLTEFVLPAPPTVHRLRSHNIGRTA